MSPTSPVKRVVVLGRAPRGLQHRKRLAVEATVLGCAPGSARALRPVSRDFRTVDAVVAAECAKPATGASLDLRRNDEARFQTLVGLGVYHGNERTAGHVNHE